MLPLEEEEEHGVTCWRERERERERDGPRSHQSRPVSKGWKNGVAQLHHWLCTTAANLFGKLPSHRRSSTEFPERNEREDRSSPFQLTRSLGTRAPSGEVTSLQEEKKGRRSGDGSKRDGYFCNSVGNGSVGKEGRFVSKRMRIRGWMYRMSRILCCLMAGSQFYRGCTSFIVSWFPRRIRDSVRFYFISCVFIYRIYYWLSRCNCQMLLRKE